MKSSPSLAIKEMSIKNHNEISLHNHLDGYYVKNEKQQA